MLTQLPEKMVENAGQQPEKTVRKREAWDKVGKYKYIIAKINAVQAEQELQRKMLRFLSEGLESFLNFEPKDIQELVVKDEIDLSILEELWFAGEYGVRPRDIAGKLGDERFTRFFVSKRLKQMNKRLEALYGNHVAEKRGHAWALTSFMRESWGSAKEELEEDAMKKE